MKDKKSKTNSKTIKFGSIKTTAKELEQALTRFSKSLKNRGK